VLCLTAANALPKVGHWKYNFVSLDSMDELKRFCEVILSSINLGSRISTRSIASLRCAMTVIGIVAHVFAGRAVSHC
jgi:hypothetical protein